MLFNRLFSMGSRPVAMVLCVILIGLCFVFVDKPLAEYLHSLDLRQGFPWLNQVTRLGLGALYLIGLPVLALVFRRVFVNWYREACCWFLWVCIVLASMVCLVSKILLGRARPDLWFQDHAFGFYWLQKKAPFWSFPSGHTSVVMSLAFGLSILFPSYSLLYLAAGLFIAISRVLLVHHYLSDVLMATWLAFLETGFLLWFFKKKQWLNVLWQRQSG